MMRQERGQISIWGILVGLLLLVSYAAYPEMYHDFFSYLVDSLLGAADKSFEGGDGRGKDKN